MKVKVPTVNPVAKTTSDKVVVVRAINEEQKQALETINNNKITFLTGIAGSGKTEISIGYALQMLMRGKYKRLIVTRPAVLADEDLGYMPGNYMEKMGYFLTPSYDAFSNYLSQEDINKMTNDGTILVIPLGYFRGITLRNSILVVDEAQNTTVKQMRMILTRLGESSKIIVNGDLRQVDLEERTNGLQHACKYLTDIDGIGYHNFSDQSVVRDKIIVDIENRYNQF